MSCSEATLHAILGSNKVHVLKQKPLCIRMYIPQTFPSLCVGTPETTLIRTHFSVSHSRTCTQLPSFPGPHSIRLHEGKIKRGPGNEAVHNRMFLVKGKVILAVVLLLELYLHVYCFSITLSYTAIVVVHRYIWEQCSSKQTNIYA